jgi:hypothetical protein
VGEGERAERWAAGWQIRQGSALSAAVSLDRIAAGTPAVAGRWEANRWAGRWDVSIWAGRWDGDTLAGDIPVLLCTLAKKTTTKVPHVVQNIIFYSVA